jgi:hypothetical protein
MKRLMLVPMLAALALAGPAAAADLTKIDRTIAKQPAYLTKSPKYCLLTFGPEAKDRFWLVLDGDRLYVDRNGNGDLTEKGQCVTSTSAWFQAGDLLGADGKAKHTRLRLRRHDGGIRLIVQVGGKHRQFVGFDDTDPLHFADRPGDAPVVHFDGPLSIRLYEGPPRFVPGKHCELNVAIGTPGLGKGTFAAIECCTVFSKGTAPLAEIDFPAREPGGKPNAVLAALGED